MSTNTAANGKRPKVSVLIPTYNYGRYIGEAIQSVLDQDMRDIEILISDDASTDNTAEVVAPFVERDSRVRYIRHEQNLGMVANWEWCLQQAQGEYVKYLFADDKFTFPYSLRYLCDMLDQHPEAVFSYSARYVIDEKSDIVELWDQGEFDGLQSGNKVIARCLALHSNVIGEPSVVLVRRHAMERGFDHSFRQLVDLEMWLHLCQRGAAVYSHAPLTSFRRHSLQQTWVNKSNSATLTEPGRVLRQYAPVLLNEIGTIKDRLRLLVSLQAAAHPRRLSGFDNPDYRLAIIELYQQIPASRRPLLWFIFRCQRLRQNISHQWRKLSPRRQP